MKEFFKHIFSVETKKRALKNNKKSLYGVSSEILSSSSSQESCSDGPKERFSCVNTFCILFQHGAAGRGRERVGASATR